MTDSGVRLSAGQEAIWHFRRLTDHYYELLYADSHFLTEFCALLDDLDADLGTPVPGPAILVSRPDQRDDPPHHRAVLRCQAFAERWHLPDGSSEENRSGVRSLLRSYGVWREESEVRLIAPHGPATNWEVRTVELPSLTLFWDHIGESTESFRLRADADISRWADEARRTISQVLAEPRPTGRLERKREPITLEMAATFFFHRYHPVASASVATLAEGLSRMEVWKNRKKVDTDEAMAERGESERKTIRQWLNLFRDVVEPAGLPAKRGLPK